MWNLTSERPIYLQLMEVIQKRIIIGTYQPGDRLPSVRELAEEAKVNPNTMQKALVELERSGLIYTQRTSGRFITEDSSMIKKMKLELANEQIRDFLDRMKQYGYEVSEITRLIMNQASNSMNDIEKEDGQ